MTKSQALVVLISASMRYHEVLAPVVEQLRALGCHVEMPEQDLGGLTKADLMARHLGKLRRSDVLLLGNIAGYVGASTFFEAGWATALGKPVFALEALDGQSEFTEDLRAAGVIELNGDIEKMVTGDCKSDGTAL